MMVVLGAVVVAVVACSNARDEHSGGSQAAVPERVRLAVLIARAVEENPAAAESLLTAYGLTPQAYDSLMYEIAADPTLTLAFDRERR